MPAPSPSSSLLAAGPAPTTRSGTALAMRALPAVAALLGVLGLTTGDDFGTRIAGGVLLACAGGLELSGWSRAVRRRARRLAVAAVAGALVGALAITCVELLGHDAAPRVAHRDTHRGN